LRRVRILLVLLVMSALLAPAAFAASPKTCATTLRGGGGEWPTVGGNNANTNIQPREKSISPDNVGELKLRWVTTNVMPGQSTPTVSGSCVYAQGGGLLNAIDVLTGELVWRADNDSGCTESDYFQIYCPFGATISGARVHVDGAGDGKPFGAAYDARTGRRIWKSKRVYFGYDASQLSSPKVAEGVHVTFTTGPDFDPGSRPGFGIFDEATGKALKIRTTNPGNSDYLGGGIWATAAVDKHGYLYVGTSNAEEAAADAEYDNSILKIDVRRSRETFGEILGNYKGDKDWITESGAFDADFGAGPTLLTVNGRQMLVAMQKSGTFHAVWTDTMTSAWKRTVGVSNVATRLDGNSAMAAYDGNRLYVTANPGILYAIDPATGETIWMAPTSLEFYTPYRPVVLANGVVYTMRINNSRLAAWEADSGEMLAEFEPTDQGGNACNSGPSGGLSIAHHMIFINCGTFVAAYGL
jgi:outer membrane protein assembly factor BamB